MKMTLLRHKHINEGELALLLPAIDARLAVLGALLDEPGPKNNPKAHEEYQTLRRFRAYHDDWVKTTHKRKEIER